MTSKDKKGLAALLILVVAVVGGTYAYRKFFGAQIGERCEEHVGCLSGGVCISHRCQKRCATDGDCPSGWGCRSTAVVVARRPALVLGKDEAENSSERICFSPAALGSSPSGARPR
jgi:hypothetical protein